MKADALLLKRGRRVVWVNTTDSIYGFSWSVKGLFAECEEVSGRLLSLFMDEMHHMYLVFTGLAKSASRNESISM